MANKIDDWLTGKSDAETPAAATAASPADRIDVFLNPSVKETKSPTTEFLGEGSPAMQAWRSYQAAGSLHNWLAPTPNTEYSSTPLVPFAKDVTTGETRWALPGPVRSLLYSATGDLSEGMTADPATGRFGTTPDMSSAINLLAGGIRTDLRFGTRVPLIEREAPLSPELKANLLSPEAKAAAKEPPAGPTTPTGIEPPPSAPVMPAAPPPATAAQAKQVASAYYDIADKSGGSLTPKFTNNFIDSLAAKIPQTEAGKVIAGESEVSALVNRAQALRDQPLSLKAAQEIDEGLGNLIDKEYGVKGLSKEGQQILDIQSTFRDQIANAGADDITGGTAGFDALGPARKAWSQAMKMDDLERIQRRANMTDNPATSIKTQIRTLLTNRSKSRGYDAEETAALEEAAQRGTLGSVLHVFGSRLIPLGAGLAEAGTHGITAGLAAAAVSHFGAAKLRDWATVLQENRLRNAMDVLGQKVPENPLNQPPP